MNFSYVVKPPVQTGVAIGNLDSLNLAQGITTITFWSFSLETFSLWCADLFFEYLCSQRFFC